MPGALGGAALPLAVPEVAPEEAALEEAAPGAVPPLAPVEGVDPAELVTAGEPAVGAAGALAEAGLEVLAPADDEAPVEAAGALTVLVLATEATLGSWAGPRADQEIAWGVVWSWTSRARS